MNGYSLYLDHQNLAPLIHALEDTLEQTYRQHGNLCSL